MDKLKIEEIAKVSKIEKWPYPKTFNALKEEGVLSYEVVTSSHRITHFDGQESFQEQVPESFQALKVAETFDVNLLKKALENTRLKITNYEEFLQEIAQAGVEYYRVEMLRNTVSYFGANSDEKYIEKVPQPLTLQQAAEHCEKAWSAFAQKHNIQRNNEFYFFKIQEELGELVRTYLELNGGEFKNKAGNDLKKQFEGDCASLIGNALILAYHFNIDIEKKLKEKFCVEKG